MKLFSQTEFERKLHTGRTFKIVSVLLAACLLWNGFSMESFANPIPESDREESLVGNVVMPAGKGFVSIYEIPGDLESMTGKLYFGSVGFVEETDDADPDITAEDVDGWMKISSGDLEGYVAIKDVKTCTKEEALEKGILEKVAVVTSQLLAVREEPDYEAEALGYVPQDEALSIEEELDGWIKIGMEDVFGYVSDQYVDVQLSYSVAESLEEEALRLKREDTISRARGQAVVDYAVQFVGNPYVWGGTSLTKGADCSGFVMAVYDYFGVSLTHSTALDRREGYAVSGIEEARAGDLICYSGHVGIYIGDGMMVHASNPRGGIKIGSVFYKEILAIRRIF